MKDLKFTPGPWQLTMVPFELRNTDDAASVYGPMSIQGGACLITSISRSPGDVEASGNAILISKAPDMYSALLKARSVFNILLGPAVVSSISNYDLEKKIEQALSEINKVLESCALFEDKQKQS